MKIGILTFHNAHNYGALLQAYALKQYLLKCSYDVEIINYINSSIEKEYLPKQKNNIKIGGFRSAKKWINKQLIISTSRKEYSEKWNKFDNFIKTYLVNSNKFFKKEDLKLDKYDYILFGSDQIWNPGLTNGFDDVYFGNVDAKKATKIAYAASLGVSKLNSKDEKIFFDLLKNFNLISVREEKLKKYIQDNTNLKATTVVDPTLLLDKEDYNNFLIDVPYKDYILQYTIIDNPILDNIVKYIAKMKNLNIIEIRYNKNIFRNGSIQIANAGIEDFLSLIYNAKFIVTNSFHGTIFSILFNKEFYTVKINGVNSRIENLLEITNLKNRCIESIDEINLNEKIDFDVAINGIKEKSELSKNFLKDAIS